MRYKRSPTGVKMLTAIFLLNNAIYSRYFTGARRGKVVLYMDSSVWIAVSQRFSHVKTFNNFKFTRFFVGEQGVENVE